MRLEDGAAELRWLWRDAPGELGMRSNHSAIISKIEGGSASSGVYDMDPRALEAARRARAIREALTGVGERGLRVLLIAYGPDGSERKVAMATAECLEAHRRSRTTRSVAEWYGRLSKAAKAGGDIERRRTWVKIQAAASELLREALTSYVARRDGATSNKGGVLGA